MVNRPKQPYRAPICRCFFGEHKLDYVDELLSESQIQATGYFDAQKVSRIVAKCRTRQGHLLSERENMALVAILSTQLLDRLFIQDFPQHSSDSFKHPHVFS